MEITFGSNSGQTLERVLFKNPSRFQWWKEKNMVDESHLFNRRQQHRYYQLNRRAENLKLRDCEECEKVPASEMVLHYDDAMMLDYITFECEPCSRENNACECVAPSFFIPNWFHIDDKGALCDAIWEHFMGDERFTQANLERFFDDPDNFVKF